MKPSGDMKMKNRHLLARSFVIFLGITVLISCSGGAGDSRDGGVVSIPEAGPAKAASCSDFPSFRYFYSRQKREGLSGWEIAYLLSLGHAPDDLAGMSFERKRSLLLPGITGISEENGSFCQLPEEEQKALEEKGITASDYQGLLAIGFQNIQWFSQEKLDILLPLDTLRERLEPDTAQDSAFFEGYPQLLENRLAMEEFEDIKRHAEQKGLSQEDIQYLRHQSIPYDMIVTLPETELQNLLWGLPQNATREEQLACLGYTSQEMDGLSAAEEAYIFPFEDLRQRLADDGFDRDTINAIQVDSKGKIKCKTIIQIIQNAEG